MTAAVLCLVSPPLMRTRVMSMTREDEGARGAHTAAWRRILQKRESERKREREREREKERKREKKKAKEEMKRKRE